MTGMETLVRYLEDQGVPYELVEHEPTMSAMAEAWVSDHPAQEVAKTVVLHDGSDYVLAAVAASDRLDLHKLRQLLETSQHLQLASEADIAERFPHFEVGAVPPFGPDVPGTEVVDRALLECSRVVCSAGDHRHSVLLDPHDIVRLASAHTGDIRED